MAAIVPREKDRIHDRCSRKQKGIAEGKGQKRQDISAFSPPAQCDIPRMAFIENATRYNRHKNLVAPSLFLPAPHPSNLQ